MTRIKDLPTFETLDPTNWIAVDSNDDAEPSGKASPATIADFVNTDLAPVRSLVEGTGITISGDPQNPTITADQGGGDMYSEIYDPQNISNDAFARENHTGEQPISTITGLQEALDEPIADGAVTLAKTDGTFGRITFDTVPQLLTGTIAGKTLSYSVGETFIVVTPGDIIEAQGFRYEVAESDAVDAHVETVGGVKLKVLVGIDGYVNVVAFGADPTGTVSSQTAFETAIANFGCVTGDPGTYLLTDTIVTGNAKYIDFPGDHQVFFQLDSLFPSTDLQPLFALNPQYANPSFNNTNIDRVRLSGFTIRGNATVVSGNVVDETGPGGIDVTWTKDDIEIKDVQFRQMVHCIYKRDASTATVVHWGIRIRGGGCYQVRRYCHIMPSLGTIDGVDIQSAYQGIDISSTNINSTTVWIKDIRAELARHIETDGDQYHLHLRNAKAFVSGYFEAGARHIWIEGTAAASQTVIEVAQFSKVNKDGDPEVNGCPILWDVSGGNAGGASLTLLGVWGYSDNNMEAFIELVPEARGTINWIGQGGGGASIFRHPDGTISQNPPESLTFLDYFNTSRVRGLMRVSTEIQSRSKIAAGYGAPFGTNAQLKVGGILSQGTGTVGAEFHADSTSPRDAAVFRNPNGQIGSIGMSASGTNFNQTSDARLKTHVAPLTGDEAAAILRLIEIHRFTWNVDGSPGQGVFAQELYEIYPDAVTPGVGDLGDADFSPWGVDYSKLVPVLVAGWKDHDDRISKLEG